VSATAALDKHPNMSRIIHLLFSLTLVVATYNTYAQSADWYVHQFMRDGNVPGVFVAVVRHDSVLFQKGFGLANVKDHLPVTASTCMELGSISKAFTDETLWYLHHHKLLHLDEFITKYLPDAPAAWSSISIHHLMDHSSGIQNYLLDPRFKAADIFNYSPSDSTVRFFLDTVSPDAMVRMFYSLPLEFKPGETWSYSNTGYYLLGIIGERAARKPFFDLVNEVFTAPLNMAQTKANELAAAEGCLLPGYINTAKDVKLAPILSSRYAFAAGAWATSGLDMIHYMKAVHLHRLPSDQAGYNWRAYPPTYHLPFTYHLGRFYSQYHGKRVFLHNGGTPGFSSSWMYVMEDSTSIIVLANRQDYAPVDALAWNILSLYTPSLKYRNQNLRGKHEMKYAKLVTDFIKAIQQRKPLPKGLSKPLRLFLDGENGRGMWNWNFERGYPTVITCVDKEALGQANAYRFLLSAKAEVSYRLTAIVNQKGEVTQLLWW
jgi:D-alanyl-D-alanine carboxypeptidase